ncbi:MAG: 2-C-methyl-D-erythritol 4-phosphate cytidylyltransferase [Chloroflexi bacterium]|nr:2-C-methyl-D-erythritol 4-phosphate cytidylyltransferase [Chloroflexota bacterium]
MTPESGGYADAVIVAAGSGVRMGGVDKGALDLAGRPLLRWAVERMRAARSVRRVVVVTAPERIADLRAQPWLGSSDLVVPGGARRQDSVTTGVRATDAEVVLVHDAARPLASSDLADRVAAAALEHGAAIPVLPVPDSLKRIEDGFVVAPVDRTYVVRAQTPQGARRALLLAALEAHATGPEAFGDEAEVLARAGIRVTTLSGEPTALKVTEPADLSLLRTMLPTERRHGWGSDSHPFGPRDGLRLGGIEIPDAPRLHGHSDGDVALHALCGGLLAAAGMGDLGRLFPAGESSTRDIDSREIVVSIVGRLRDAGITPMTADVHLAAARPRLGGARLDAMRATMAALLGIEPDRIAVAASTGNLSGDEGAGRVISATALVEVTSS